MLRESEFLMPPLAATPHPNTFGCSQAANEAKAGGGGEEAAGTERSSFRSLLRQRLREHILPAATKAPLLLEVLVI